MPLARLSHGARRRGRGPVRRVGSVAGIRWRRPYGASLRVWPRSGLSLWRSASASPALDLGGLPLSSLLTARPWAIAVATSLGPASTLAGLGLAAIAVGRRSAGMDARDGRRGGCRELCPHRACRLRGAAPADRARLVPACSVRRLLGSARSCRCCGACVCRTARPQPCCAASRALPWSRSRCSSIAGTALAWVQLGGDAGGTVGDRLRPAPAG